MVPPPRQVTLPANWRSGAAIAAAVVIAAGAVAPSWLGWAPTLTAFTMTGATALWILEPHGGRPGATLPSNTVRTAVLSVVLSTAIVILAAVGLDVAGVAIGRASVALTLAAVQMALTVGCAARRWPQPVERARHEHVTRPGARVVTGAAVIVLGAAALVGTVVAVHAVAPAPPITPYARISWAAGTAQATVEPVSPGPVTTTVMVQAVGSAGNVEVREYLDSAEMAAPVTVDLRPGAPLAVTLSGTYPRLDGCIHRVDVTLSPPDGGSALSVTRYVRDASAGGCHGS